MEWEEVMMRTPLVTTIAVLASQSALAGGIERSVPSLSFMFEEGNYAEISTALVTPRVSGVQAIPTSATSPAGSESGNMTRSYLQSSIALKLGLTDALSFGLVIDQPAGAGVSYPAGTGYTFAGATASVSGVEVRGILKYTMPNNFSVIAGLRQQMVSGEVHLPAANGGAGYRMSTNTSNETGYLAGVAWERKDIAARVALTYYSEMSHTFDVQEGVTAGTAAAPAFTSVIPESIRLDFQTGVAPGTLVFGSVHHQKWSKFDITPVGFNAATGSSLVDLKDDVTTYSLGVGRQLNDRLSGSVSATYEKSNGGFAGNLSPTDGRTALALGLRYKLSDTATLSGGVSYSWLGDAVTEAPSPAPAGVTLSNFNDNTTLAIGFKVGFKF